MTPEEFVHGLADAGYPFRDKEEDEEEPEPLMVNLYEVVDGQGAIETCTCGESITEYDGEWYHIFNPALTGADDHTASPD